MPRLAFRLLPTAALGAVLLAMLLEPALAQTKPPAPNKGDTAWMLFATVLVLMMTIPGLALFYARAGACQERGLHADAGVRYRLHGGDPVGDLRLQPRLYQRRRRQRLRGRPFQGLPDGRHAGQHRCDLLQRRGDPGVRLHRLPDDLCLHHPRTDRRRVRGAHEVLRAHAVRRAVGHVRVFPHRPHGLVLGRSRRDGRGGHQARAGGRRRGQGSGREGARRGPGRRGNRLPDGAPSTSPAARWCTSTPASPPWWEP